MWGKFGDVIFQLLKTPETLSRGNKAKFARISLFGEKEKLHFTGLENETLSLSIKFNAFFCKPLEEVETLREYLNSGEGYTLIIGDYVHGKYVIEDLKEEVHQTDKNGNPVAISVTLTLREDRSDSET